MRRYRTRAFLSSLALGLIAVFGVATPAHAAVSPACEAWRLTPGSATGTISATQVTLRTQFTLTPQQVAAVRCAGQFMKLYAAVTGGGGSGTNYDLSTNLESSPGQPAAKRAPAVPSAFEPGVINVNTLLLQPGVAYIVTTTWPRTSSTSPTPTMRVYQHADRLARSEFERSHCRYPCTIPLGWVELTNGPTAFVGTLIF